MDGDFVSLVRSIPENGALRLVIQAAISHEFCTTGFYVPRDDALSFLSLLSEVMQSGYAFEEKKATLQWRKELVASFPGAEDIPPKAMDFLLAVTRRRSDVRIGYEVVGRFPSAPELNDAGAAYPTDWKYHWEHSEDEWRAVELEIKTQQDRLQGMEDDVNPLSDKNIRQALGTSVAIVAGALMFMAYRRVRSKQD